MDDPSTLIVSAIIATVWTIIANRVYKSSAQEEMWRDAEARNLAHYDPKTGKWTWNEGLPVNPEQSD